MFLSLTAATICKNKRQVFDVVCRIVQSQKLLVAVGVFRLKYYWLEKALKPSQ